MRYEILEHTADIGIVAHGASLEKLLENAAYGMFDLMFDLSVLEPTVETAIEIDPEEEPTELLHRWLSELLYRFEADETVWSRFSVEFRGGGLTSTVRGAGIAGLELRGTPVKAVTFHNLYLQRHGSNWTATVLFDI